MPIKLDCHIHTKFSPDGREEPEAIITKAISMGIKHIAFTDHMDIMYANDQFIGLSVFDEYFATLLPLKEKYSKQIYVAIGIEAGYSRKGRADTKKIIESTPFEYIINSIHEVNGSDCYYPEHYLGREKNIVYNEYFDAILESLNCGYRYDAIGHLAYVSRTAPYPDKIIYYDDFKDKFDIILKEIIKKDKILELNTNVYKAGTLTLPHSDVVNRYRELGGKLITFSSDAHTLARLGESYEAVAEMVKEIGFTQYAAKQNNKIVMMKID